MEVENLKQVCSVFMSRNESIAINSKVLSLLLKYKNSAGNRVLVLGTFKMREVLNNLPLSSSITS